MKKYVLIILTLGISLSLVAQIKTRNYEDDPYWVPREHFVDMTNLKLDVSFVPTESKVIGDVEHSFMVLKTGVKELELDAPKIQISKVYLDGTEVKFSSTDEIVKIDFGKELARDSKHTVRLEYVAYPKMGIYFIGWNDEKNLSRKQIWTQGQFYDNRYWMPMYDAQNDKVTTDVYVTFDAKYKVLSNGDRKEEKDLGNGNKKWYYQMTKPHAPYLLMLGIGEYAIQSTKSGSGVPMEWWYYPESPEKVEHTYMNSADMIDWMEKETGVPFPWGSYAQIPVQDFMYGAMENTTATLFGDFFLCDKRERIDNEYIYVNAHELAHQWFGDYITERTQSHHWLQESFATYYGRMYAQTIYGKEYHDYKRREATEASLQESKKDWHGIMHGDAGNVRFYPKGAHVLHMLKYVLGEEDYRKGITYYLKKHPYSNVDSEDLLIAFHEALGVSLDWFWEDWVYHGGEPHYKVEFNDITIHGERKAQFVVTQTHEMNNLVDLFKMPIVFEVYYTDGTKESIKEWIEEEQEIVLLSLQAKKKIDYVLFDPDAMVMKKVDFKKPIEMSKAQAIKAEYLLDRVDAIEALSKVDFKDKKEVFEKVFTNEKHFYAKSKVLEQLYKEDIGLTKDLYLKAINEVSAELRYALIESLKIIPSELEGELRKMLNDPSYEVSEHTMDALFTSFPENTLAYLELTKENKGSNMRLRIKWLQFAYLNDPKTEYINELKGYVTHSYEFLTRINAMEALSELAYLDEALLPELITTTESTNVKTSDTAKTLLKTLFGMSKPKQIMLTYIKEKKEGFDLLKKVLGL